MDGAGVEEDLDFCTGGEAEEGGGGGLPATCGDPESARSTGFLLDVGGGGNAGGGGSDEREGSVEVPAFRMANGPEVGLKLLEERFAKRCKWREREWARTIDS